MTAQELLVLNDPSIGTLRVQYGDQFEQIRSRDISELLDVLIVVHIDPELDDRTLDELLADDDVIAELEVYPQWMQDFAITQAKAPYEVQNAVWGIIESMYP